MMFRAISNLSGKFVYGCYTQYSPAEMRDKFYGKHFIIDSAGSLFDIDVSTLGKLTPWEDKNGYQYYEGDIAVKYAVDGTSDEFKDWVDCDSDKSEDHEALYRAIPLKVEHKGVVSLAYPHTWLDNEKFGHEGELLVCPSETVCEGNKWGK